MADRYTKLFSLAPNLYVEESPVVIAAGALLLDNKTNQVLAQLKVRNIGSKAIKAVAVKITPFDTAGRSLGEPVMSQYLDLALNRDQEFGQKLPIALPNNATRSFSVAVSEVVFVDNEIWTCSQDEWKSLPAAKPLNSWLTDSELEKQYKLQYGQDCSYVPERIEDLWYCACGAINRNDEETCHNCGKSISTLLSVDLAELTAEKDARMEKEAEAETARLKKKAEEEAARQKREAEEKAAADAKAAENRRKGQNITIVVFASLAVIIGAILLLTKVIIPNNNYNKAQALLAEGKYEEATATFEKLGDYKDSAEMVLECQYQEAIALAESCEYEKAIAIFEMLDNYKDCITRKTDTQAAWDEDKKRISYETAEKMFDQGNYSGAGDAFYYLGDFKDSADRALECRYLQAVKLLEDGNLEEAFECFLKISEYKDVEEYLNGFVYLPETINCNDHDGHASTFYINYSENGRMVSADRYSSYHYSKYEKRNVYYFDTNGWLVKEDYLGEFSRTLEYSYNDNGTVASWSETDDSKVYEFDQYGNVKSFYYTNGAKRDFTYKYDGQHNRYDNATNTYIQIGSISYLTNVKCIDVNHVVDSEIQYKLYYLTERDEDLLVVIWRNLRIMTRSEIWKMTGS